MCPRFGTDGIGNTGYWDEISLLVSVGTWTPIAHSYAAGILDMRLRGSKCRKAAGAQTWGPCGWKDGHLRGQWPGLPNLLTLPETWHPRTFLEERQCPGMTEVEFLPAW